MKTYLRVLRFANPLYKYAIPYFFLSLLTAAFGVINLSLLIPLLDTLFKNTSEFELQFLLSEPGPAFNLHFFIENFNYYFAWVVVAYGKLGALQFICISIVCSVLVSNICFYLARRVIEYMRANTIQNVREALYSHVLKLDLSYFSETRKGDIISRATTDVKEIEVTIADTLDVTFKEPLAINAFFVALFHISVELTLFTLLVIPIAGITIGFLSKRLKSRAKSTQEVIGMIVSILDETLGGLRVIKGFNAQPYIKQKFDKENQYYTNLMKSMARIRELASPLSETLGVMVVAGILLYGGSLVLSEDSDLTASAFIAYILIFSQILSPAKKMANAISRIQRGMAAAERIFKIMDAEPQIQDVSNAVKLTEFQKSIEFKEVSFRYEEDWVLKDINFTLEKGKTIALVGPSGSGKSTISDLIPRFYEVQKGQVLIDHQDIRDIELTSLIAQMGIVSQDTILFNDTVFNNIAFGNIQATQEDVEQAAKIANAHEFITKFTNGYETVIGDRGLKMAGGQRQRIAIARAILKNPPILILDEATSALDAENEKLVQEALYKLMQNRTSLVIAHRLSTIQNADEILVMQKGEIIERGTHQSLMQEEGLYNKLKTMQAL